jgi:cytochrome c biogenesis factor
VSVNASDLFNLIYFFYFIFSCWAGIALYNMNIFIYCVSRGEPFYFFLFIIFYLVLLYIIAVNLGCVILNTDIIVIVITEILFYFAGAIIKLVLIYIAISYHSNINNSIGHFRICEFDNYWGYAFENGFLN